MRFSRLTRTAGTHGVRPPFHMDSNKEIRHMAEASFILTTFYTSWKAYQEHIKESLAPLSAEQLTLRAAPGLRSVGENAAHIIGCRAGWFTDFLREDGGAEGKEMAAWGIPGAPGQTA